MEKSLVDEIYSEVLQPKADLGHTSLRDSKQDVNGDELWREDVSLWNNDMEELDNVSDLNREWQRRRTLFHTVGYRDGLMAGKEASAQAGFNVGFNESVFDGFDWGRVRGFTSALACLPDGLKERMVETQEKRTKFSQLYESVSSLSTTDALKLFHYDISSQFLKQSGSAGCISTRLNSHDQSSESSLLNKYYGELQSLLSEFPAVEMHLKMDQ